MLSFNHQGAFEQNIQLIQKRLSFNNLKPQTLNAQGMMDVAYLEPRSGHIS